MAGVEDPNKIYRLQGQLHEHKVIDYLPKEVEKRLESLLDEEERQNAIKDGNRNARTTAV